MDVIVRGILRRGWRWEKLLGEEIPGGVITGMRRFEFEQGFVDGLLFHAWTSCQKLDMAHLLGKIIKCLAVRLPNVYGDDRIFHGFHTH